MKKLKRIWMGIVVCTCLMVLGLPPFSCHAQEVPVIYCTALGDSIAKGYAGRKQEDFESYSKLAMDMVSEETGISVEYVNYAKNGLESSGLNSEILSTEEALADIAAADIITLTIGANDLMKEFKNAAQEVLGTERRFASVYDAFDALQEGVEGNPLLIVKVLDVLDNWNYDAFEEQWIAAMDTISHSRKDGSQLVVTDIYNPVSRFELPGTMNSMVEEIIWNMNQIMYQYATQYDYRVVDLFESDICEHTLDDGLHPDQEGQKLIAQLTKEKIDAGRFVEEPGEEPEEDSQGEPKEEPKPEKLVRRRSMAGNIRRAVLLVLGTVILISAAVICMKRKKKRGKQ